MSSVGQNKQIRYECDRDYKLVGPNGSTCINGNWKPSVRLVKCARDDPSSTLLMNTFKPVNILDPSKVSLYKDKRGKNKEKKEKDETVGSESQSQLKRLKKHKSKRLNSSNSTTVSPVVRRRLRMKKNQQRANNKSQEEDNKSARRIHHEKKTYLNY